MKNNEFIKKEKGWRIIKIGERERGRKKKDRKYKKNV